MNTPAFIENLRSKPHSHRRRVQILVPIAITFLIVVFWVFSFGSHVQNIVQAEKTDDKPSPFKVLANSFASIFTDIKDGASITADRLAGEEEKTQNDGANMIYVKE